MLKKFALGTSIAVFVTVTAHAAVVKEGSCGNNCAYQIEDNNGYVLTIRNTGENSDEFTMTSRTWNNSPYNSAPIKVVMEPGVTTIMDKAFKEMKVTDVTIPEGVTHIGDRAFYDMTSDGTSGEGTLKNIVLPSSLKDIGQYAFSGQGIVSLALPEGLETLGQGAFSHNTSMENVFIPESLSTVSKKAFYNDTSLIDDGNIYCTDTDERTCEDLLANATGSASTDAANNAAILSNIQYYTMEDTMYVVKDSQGNKTYFKSPATLMTGSVCDESCQTEILTELYPERYLEPDPVVENEDDNDDTAESEVSQPVGESISRESMRIYTVQEIAKVVRDDKNTIKVRYK